MRKNVISRPHAVVGVVVAALVATAAAAQDAAQSIDMTREVAQPERVKALYPDLPLDLTAPSLAPGRTAFTSQEELETFVLALGQAHHNVVVGKLGLTQQGRDIPYLVFTAEGIGDAATIRGLGRPIVWLVGQQHGNEPAGGEAMLALAHALAGGELASLLDRITVVIVPRANPDGVALFRRTTANGLDMNRDYILLSLPETRAIEAKAAELPPDIIVDAHEFSVVNRWLEKFGAYEASDAMILEATHPMVPPEVSRLANELLTPAIDAAFGKLGLTRFWYHTTSTNVADRVVSMGGNAPGIARNAFGLANAVSYLIETRGVGIRREGWQRRVGTHYVMARAILQTAAQEAATIELRLAAAREHAAASTAELVLAAKLAVTPLDIPFVDPETGERRLINVAFEDSRTVTPILTRPRPPGYYIEPAATAPTAALRLRHIGMCALAGPIESEVESFLVETVGRPVDRRAINPDQTIKSALVRRRVVLPAGTIFVPLDQPDANAVIVALEPDSPGSFAGVGLVPITNGLVAIHRAVAGTREARVATDAGSGAQCRF
jgi:hypothetical protein